MTEMVMRILGLVSGGRTSFDGEWLVEYDPGVDGFGRNGELMTARIVTTRDREQAHRFPDAAAAHACWTLVDPREPVRADGKPNRPLTAFSVVIERVEHAGSPWTPGVLARRD